MIQRTEVAGLEAELREMQVRVPELQQTVHEQAEKLKALGERTPRPEWHEQRGLLPSCEQHIVPVSMKAGKPTAIIAGKLISRLSHYSTQLDVRSLRLAVQKGRVLLVMLMNSRLSERSGGFQRPGPPSENGAVRPA